jgi:hypothetical protein
MERYAIYDRNEEERPVRAAFGDGNVARVVYGQEDVGCFCEVGEWTLEVFISMNAIEGRRRTMLEEGYLRSSSRSRYLFAISMDSDARGNGGVVTLPRMLLSV